MNNLNQVNPASDNNNKKAVVKPPQNLLEVAKDFGSDFKNQARAATLGTLNTATGQITGTIYDRQPSQTDRLAQPQAPFNFAEYLRSREMQIRQQERMMGQQQRSAETMIFHRKEEEAKKEVEIVKAEIKKLVIETGKVSTELREAEKTVMTTTTEAGTYHLNFFERIRNLISLARKNISESKTWLQMFNGRNKNKSFYWAQVKKSGTKFMLSNERTVATQTG